ncbi:MAG: AI-2E family transporter [Balneolaceae bacterium]
MNLSFQKLFYVIATVFALFAILVLAKSILIPLSVALLISFILYPFVKKLESWGVNKAFAAFLSIFTVFLIVGGVIFFFSTQIIKLSVEFSNFQDSILLSFTDITLYINKNVPFIQDLEKNELFEWLKNWLTESTGALVSKSISDTTAFLAGLLATTVFTFLILIYRKGLTSGFAEFASEDNRAKVLKMFKSVQQVGQKYLLGMVLLVIVIGLTNSIGLWIIGIDNPFLFGFLGATLSIIPYIGTVLGAIIPIVYAFVSTNSVWMPMAVAILFWAVQLVTDNFLTPKIVGSSLRINALTAILSLIVGAVVWGVAGMILFLPFAAMLKVVCEEFEALKPVALLIGNQNYQENEEKESSVHKWFKKA